jgi:hypothetical protein
MVLVKNCYFNDGLISNNNMEQKVLVIISNSKQVLFSKIMHKVKSRLTKGEPGRRDRQTDRHIEIQEEKKKRKEIKKDLSPLCYRISFRLTLGYSVVAKVVDSQNQYNTDTILANANLAIGDQMQLVVEDHLGMELLGID